MATHRRPIISQNMLPDAAVFPDRVGNQITAAAAPSVGGQLCYVMAAGADEGFQNKCAIWGHKRGWTRQNESEWVILFQFSRLWFYI